MIMYSSGNSTDIYEKTYLPSLVCNSVIIIIAFIWLSFEYEKSKFTTLIILICTACWFLTTALIGLVNYIYSKSPLGLSIFIICLLVAIVLMCIIEYKSKNSTITPMPDIYKDYILYSVYVLFVEMGLAFICLYHYRSSIMLNFIKSISVAITLFLVMDYLLKMDQGRILSSIFYIILINIIGFGSTKTISKNLTMMTVDLELLQKELAMSKDIITELNKEANEAFENTKGDLLKTCEDLEKNNLDEEYVLKGNYVTAIKQHSDNLEKNNKSIEEKTKHINERIMALKATPSKEIINNVESAIKEGESIEQYSSSAVLHGIKQYENERNYDLIDEIKDKIPFNGGNTAGNFYGFSQQSEPKNMLGSSVLMNSFVALDKGKTLLSRSKDGYNISVVSHSGSIAIHINELCFVFIDNCIIIQEEEKVIASCRNGYTLVPLRQSDIVLDKDGTIINLQPENGGRLCAFDQRNKQTKLYVKIIPSNSWVVQDDDNLLYRLDITNNNIKTIKKNGKKITTDIVDVSVEVGEIKIICNNAELSIEQGSKSIIEFLLNDKGINKYREHTDIKFSDIKNK